MSLDKKEIDLLAKHTIFLNQQVSERTAFYLIEAMSKVIIEQRENGMPDAIIVNGVLSWFVDFLSNDPKRHSLLNGIIQEIIGDAQVAMDTIDLTDEMIKKITEENNG